MTLFYLVADRLTSSPDTIYVRTEVIRRGESTAYYHQIISRSFVKAKLRALREVLKQIHLPETEAITIFPDAYNIVQAWGEMDAMLLPSSCRTEWEKLCKDLEQFQARPQFRADSCLSVAMRSDLKIYLAKQGGCY